MSIFDIPFGGLTADGAISLAAAAAAFVSVYALWHGLVAGDPLAARAKSLRRHRETLKNNLLSPTKSRHRPVDAMGLMRRVILRFDLMRGELAEKAARRLAAAGWRSKDAVVAFLFFKMVLPFASGGAAVVVVHAGGGFDLSTMEQLLVAMVCVVAGAYAPEMFVRKATNKRRGNIAKGLPDALDLLVICSEAGLALDAALGRVAGEMELACPQIADELHLTSVELGFLPERREALQNLIRRTQMPSVRGVVNALIQTEKYGTPLAQSLRVLASEFRHERMMKAEEKAAKLPATLTIPLIAFIMPTLFVVLLGPAVLRAVDGLGGLSFEHLGGI